jgi:hypothetical protein
LFQSSPVENFEQKFHEKCDGKGPTLVVVETTEGHVFGGFTSTSWALPKKTTGYSAESAWLFHLRDGEIMKAKRIEYNGEKEEDDAPIWICVEDGLVSGPVFGGADIMVWPTSGCVCSKCAYSQGILSDSSDEEDFTLKNMEVYRVVNLLD